MLVLHLFFVNLHRIRVENGCEYNLDVNDRWKSLN